MKLKVGDKVTLLLDNIPILPRKYCSGAISGEIIRPCVVKDCMVVRLNNGRERHLLTQWLSFTPIKNQQLLFEFMNKD